MMAAKTTPHGNGDKRGEDDGEQKECPIGADKFKEYAVSLHIIFSSEKILLKISREIMCV